MSQSHMGDLVVFSPIAVLVDFQDYTGCQRKQPLTWVVGSNVVKREAQPWHVGVIGTARSLSGRHASSRVKRGK
jgi:hypothetical protein